MKREFKEYLDSINSTSVLSARVEYFINVVESLYNVTISDVFVCSVKINEQIDYPSLWFFTNDKFFECKSFLTKQNIDVTIIKDSIRYHNLIFNAFDDFVENKPNEQSTVQVLITFKDNISSIFNAYGVNCKYLVEFSSPFILLLYLIYSKYNIIIRVA